MRKIKKCNNGHENEIDAVFCELCGLTFPDILSNDDILEKEDEHVDISPTTSERILTSKAEKKASVPAPSNFGPMLGKIAKILIPLIIIAGAAFYLVPKFFGGKIDKGYLTLSGSSTIGIDLMPELAKSYLEKKVGATNVRIERSESEKLIKVIGTTTTGEQIIRILYGGSSSGISHLKEDSCDIAMTSRILSEDEVTDQLNHTSASEHILAIDGAAVIVSEENPVSQLNLLSVGEIFSGNRSEWAEFGNYFGSINLYNQDKKAGMSEISKILTNLIPGGFKQGSNQEKASYMTNPEVTKAVSQDKFSIGYVNLSSAKNVKTIGIRGAQNQIFLPSTNNMNTEDYPLTHRLFLYQMSNVNNPSIAKFIEFCTSAEGQEIVEKFGFSAGKIDCMQTPLPQEVEGLPSSYLELYQTPGTCRLSASLRFAKKDEFDSKAELDLNRIAAYVESKGNKTVVLCGFVNNSGDSINDQTRSEELLAKASRVLESKGMRVETLACGSSNPLIDAKLELARTKNTRIEVWIK